jgi:hypothetical protein
MFLSAQGARVVGTFSSESVDAAGVARGAATALLEVGGRGVVDAQGARVG